MNQGDRATDEWPAEHDYADAGELGQFDVGGATPLVGWRRTAALTAIGLVAGALVAAAAWLAYQLVIVVDWLVRVAP